MPARRLVRFHLPLALVALLAASSAAAEPLAVLASARGAVEVAPAKGPRVRAAFGRALERGDRVLVPAGGSATVFFQDGNVVELGEKSTLVVGGRAPAPSAKGGLPGEVYASVSRFVTDGSRETGLVAVSTLRGGPDEVALLLSPRKTALLEPRPTFRWRPVAGATRYQVTLSGDAGALWQRETAADSLVFPAEAAPLVAGADYVWEVRAGAEDRELRREETVLHVADAAEAEAVRAALGRIAQGAGTDAAAARFLAGSYLSGRGLYQDALAEFQELGRLSPDSPAPHEAMGHLYRAVGLMDLAAAEYQRALTLGRP